MADNNEALLRLKELGFEPQPSVDDEVGAKLKALGFGPTGFPTGQMTPALGQQMESARRGGIGLATLGGETPEQAQSNLTRMATEAGVEPTQMHQLTGKGRPAQIEALRPDSFLYDVAGGIYDKLADGIGLMSYTVGQRLDRLGATSALNAVLKPLSVQVGNAKSAEEVQAAVKWAGEALGLRAVGEDESFGGKVGHVTVDNLLAMAAMLYGAGAVASALKPGMLKNLFTTLGPELKAFIKANPLMSAATELGAATTSTAAGNIAREQGMGDTGEFIGQFIGGPVGAMGAQRLFKIAQGPARFLMKMFAPSGGDILTDVVGGTAGNARTLVSPAALRPSARYHIQGQLDQLMGVVRQPLGDLSSTPDSNTLAQRFYQGITNARQRAAQISQQNWKKSSAGTAWVNTENLRATAEDMIRRGVRVEMREGKLYTKEGIPDFAQQIINETELAAGSKSKFTSKPLRVKNMLDWLQRIDRAQQRYLKAPPNLRNTQAIENLSTLEREIISTIETAVRDPNMSTAQQYAVLEALEFDQQSRNLFREGPLGEVIDAIENRAPQMPPDAVVSQFLNREGGLDAVRQGASFNPQLVSDYTAYVGGELRDQLVTLAQANDPERGVAVVNKWFNNHRKLLDGLGQEGARMAAGVSDMNQALGQRTLLERSALARVAGLPSESSEDIMRGLQEVVNSENAPELLRELMKMTKGSGTATGGLKNGLLSVLWARAAKPSASGPGFGFTPTNAVSPVGFQQVLQNEHVVEMLKAVFSPKEIAHITKTAAKAAELERSGGTGLYAARIIMARVVGASAGGHLAGLIGTGGIQIPAIGSSVARGMAEKALGGLQADELFVRALYDPYWAKVLNMKSPTNTQEARQLSKRFRKAVSHISRANTVWDYVQNEGDEQ